jgi:hypothetical protein
MSCEISENCFRANVSCWVCKYAEPGNVDNFYVPINKSIKHPQAVAAQAERKANIKAEKQAKKANKDKDKSRMVKDAAKVENRVKATLNSGRINRDGDLTSARIAIDVKHQPSRENPTIFRSEFTKIQHDAIRAGKDYGALFIVNKLGERFVVIPEEMFKEFLHE